MFHVLRMKAQMLHLLFWNNHCHWKKFWHFQTVWFLEYNLGLLLSLQRKIMDKSIGYTLDIEVQNRYFKEQKLHVSETTQLHVCKLLGLTNLLLPAQPPWGNLWPLPSHSQLSHDAPMVQGSTGYSGTQKLCKNKCICTKLITYQNQIPVSWYMYAIPGKQVSSQIAINSI